MTLIGRVDAVVTGPPDARPIGQFRLGVNELVMNAIKYAFPGGTKGTVTVTMKRTPAELRVTGRRRRPKGSILDGAIPDSATGWSTASPNRSGARSSERATAGAPP